QLSDAENQYILDSLDHQNVGEVDERWVMQLTGDDYPWDAALQRMSADAASEMTAELEERSASVLLANQWSSALGLQTITCMRRWVTIPMPSPQPKWSNLFTDVMSSSRCWKIAAKPSREWAIKTAR
ncbi:hypothetical protein, partial [Rhodopirellula bahusiensis]|uniref:hypothetical protein n=1 Tax=Rhodopirellula bahusiensis TaxID=2014065 RepID=UPI003262D3A8